MLVFYLVFCICYISFQFTSLCYWDILVSCLAPSELHLFYKECEGSLMGSILFDAKDVCGHLMYKIASARESKEWKKEFLFQKLQLSLVLSSQTPMGFLGHYMKHTVTIISRQEDTFKETYHIDSLHC